MADAECPPPRSSPEVTRGGNSATATITPIRVVETPVVNASAPAQPDANATATSPSPTPLREATSGVAGFRCSGTPMITDRAIAKAIPAMAVRSARRSNDTSPNVVPSDNAMFGPSKGAITIAPMMMATLL